MTGTTSAVERVLERIKRHPVIALFAVVGTVLVTLSAFTDAAQNLLQLLDRPPVVALDGRWVTEELINPFDGKTRYRLVLELTDHGGTVAGDLRLERPEGGGLTEYGLFEGRLDGTTLTFQTLGQSYMGTETVNYRDYYVGEIATDEIAFTVTSDRPWGFPAQRFAARRER